VRTLKSQFFKTIKMKEKELNERMDAIEKASIDSEDRALIASLIKESDCSKVKVMHKQNATKIEDEVYNLSYKNDRTILQSIIDLERSFED